MIFAEEWSDGANKAQPKSHAPRLTRSKIATASYVKARRIISLAHEMKFLRAAACCEHTAQFGGIRFGNGGGAEHVEFRGSRTNGGVRQGGWRGLAEMRIEGNIGT